MRGIISLLGAAGIGLVWGWLCAMRVAVRWAIVTVGALMAATGVLIAEAALLLDVQSSLWTMAGTGVGFGMHMIWIARLRARRQDRVP
jgi:hypothetical protein